MMGRTTVWMSNHSNRLTDMLCMTLAYFCLYDKSSTIHNCPETRTPIEVAHLIWKFYDALILQSAIPFAEVVLSCLTMCC